MKLEPYQILSILDRCGIWHESKPNHKGWVKIKCPLHDDKHPSAGVNLLNGTLNCWSCPETPLSIIDYLKQELRLDYKGVVDWIDSSISVLPKRYVEVKKEDNQTVDYKNDDDYPFMNIDLNPDKYDYTQQRGFTKEWCKKHNIKLSLHEYYEKDVVYIPEDYMIIPIKDSRQNINTIECRKVMEYEYLKKYFRSNDTHFSLKERFKRVEPALKKPLDDWEKYLTAPKTLYPRNAHVDKTIFDIDFLNFEEDIYVSEGIASLPKISQIYKNCTCVFGTNITPGQIKIFKNFKKNIILIPDDDQAGDDMVNFMSEYFQNLLILPVGVDDTDKTYQHRLKSLDYMRHAEYLQGRDYYYKETEK